MTKKFLVPIVLPADPAAAMEAATKQYVDGKIVTSGSEVEIQAADPIGANPAAELWFDTDATPSTSFVARTGDTMTGALTLPAANPTTNNHATRKKYVDDQNALCALGIVKKGNITFTVGGQLTANTVTNITDTISFTPLSGRRYRLVLIVRACGTVTASYVRGICGGSNQVQATGADSYTWVGGSYAMLFFQAIFDGNGTAQTFIGQAFTPVSGMTIHGDMMTSNFYLEDVGPVR